MWRVYILPVDRKGPVDTVRGIEYIHDAHLIYDEGKATLTQDTTEIEHNKLSAIALSHREARIEEINYVKSIQR